MMRFLIFFSVILCSCQKPTGAPTRVFARPIDVAVTCFDAASNPIPATSCNTSSSILAWVLDADRAAVGILSLNDGLHLDTDPFLPGFTSLPIRGPDNTLVPDLVSIQADRTSSAVYVLSRKGRVIVRIQPRTLEQTSQPIPCEASSFDITSQGPIGEALLVACPDPPGIAIIPLQTFGMNDPSSIALLPTTGRPHSLAVTEDGATAYITHYPRWLEARYGYLSRLDLATGAEARAPLLPQCADGLDNDEDGFTDNQDPGCEGPDDDSEAPDPSPACKDGADSDLQGSIDLSVSDCALQGAREFLAFASCSNGLDDDNDGLTDWPDDPDCYGPLSTEDEPPTKRIGRPAVTADGKFVYVPVAPPPAIAVFETAPFRHIDVTAMDGPAPNILLHRLGIGDILLMSPATDLAMVRSDNGNRAIVGLASGQLLSIQVDINGQATHEPEIAERPQTLSKISIPLVRLGNSRIGYVSDISSEYPSFGSNLIEPIDLSKGLYSYYGIVSGSDPNLQLPETWHITYEGAIPGTRSDTGFFDLTTGVFSDPKQNFCALGVEPGDHLVLRNPHPLCLVGNTQQDYTCPKPPPDAAVGGPVANGCEFLISQVKRSALKLEQLPGFMDLSILAYFPGPLAYEVRAASSWVVVGSRSGFAHNKIAVGDDCAERPDSDVRFTGRAYTSVVKDGLSLSSCPVAKGSAAVEWFEFTNFAFSFTIFPPCRVGETMRIELCGVYRDTEITFSVAQGVPYKVGTLEGFPLGLKAAGPWLAVVDPVFGGVHLVDWNTLAVWKTFY